MKFLTLSKISIFAVALLSGATLSGIPESLNNDPVFTPLQNVSSNQQSVSVVDLEIPETSVIISSFNVASLDAKVEVTSEYPEVTKDSFAIGDLMILDNLFSASNSQLSPDTTSIGDLFILNALFNLSTIGSPENQYNLGDLFVLDKLFNGSQTPLLDQKHSTLSDLFILDKLFNK